MQTIQTTNLETSTEKEQTISKFVSEIGIAKQYIGENNVLNCADGVIHDVEKHIGLYFNLDNVENYLKMDWDLYYIPASRTTSFQLDISDKPIHDVVIIESLDGAQSVFQEKYIDAVEAIYGINLLENPEKARLTGREEWPVLVNSPDDDTFIIIAPLGNLSYPIEEHY